MKKERRLTRTNSSAAKIRPASLQVPERVKDIESSIPART